MVVEHLQKSNPTTPVLCLYFEYKASKTIRPSQMIGSLLKQLIQFKGSVVSQEINEVYKKAVRTNSAPTEAEITMVFRNAVQKFDRVYVVVDALDESTSECRDLVETVLLGMVSDKLKLLTTSRVDEEPRATHRIVCDLCNQISGLYYRCHECGSSQPFNLCRPCKKKGSRCARNPRHEIGPPDFIGIAICIPNEELGNFILSEIKNQMRPERAEDPDLSTPLGSLASENPQFLSHVVTTIVENSDGRFLLAKLLTRSISNEVIKAKIKRALKQINTRCYGLSDTMDMLWKVEIERIKDQESLHVAIAMKTLAFVSGARRTLRLKELQHALATDLYPDDIDYDADGEPDIQDILHTTKGLIKVERDGDELVRLDHWTLVNYLLKNQELFKTETHLATICLRYLGFDGVAKPGQSKEDVEAKLKRYSFLGYALEYWGDHALEAGVSVEAEAVKFLQDPLRVKAYIQGAWAADTQAEKWDVRREIHPLHICAWFGLDSIIELLDFENLIDIDVQEKTYGQTPLMYACRRGKITTARKLLDIGASINVTSARGRNALFEAVIAKNQDMVQLLVKYGPLDVNSRNPTMYDRTSLMVASRLGYTEIAKILLARENILVNLQDSNGYTALCLAAAYQPLDPADSQSLLDFINALVATPGIEINTTARDGGSALLLAIGKDDMAIVSTLLHSGADPNLRDKEGATPCMSAITLFKSIELVKAFFEYPIDLTCVDNEGRTLIHGAAENGSCEILRLLAERGLDINLPDMFSMTPLHAASRVGSVDAARFLLDKGADPTMLDSFRRTPFIVAAQYGHTELKDILRLYNIAEIVAAYDAPENLPLWSLARLRRLDLIHLALSSGRTNLEIQEPVTENTALHWIIISWHTDCLEILHELIEVGKLNPNAQNKSKRTPLHLAVIHGLFEPVDILLKHDVMTDEVDVYGLTALSDSVSNAHRDKNFDIAIRLIESGVNIKATPISNADLHLLLFAAIDLGNAIAVRRLMQAGADRMALDERGRTADELAKERGNLTVLSTLRTRGSFIYHAKKEEDSEIIDQGDINDVLTN
jgi:ankyrin repeat protein